jgi:Rrf2 family protein
MPGVILSASATHALRAVAYLAAHGGERAVLGRDLARRVHVPAQFLAKVLGTLARAGVVKASRGVNGGYRLGRPPSRIRLLEVVEPFEGQRSRPGCLLRPGERCRASDACSAHERWSTVKDAYLHFLERTTVKDIGGTL